MYHKLIDFLRKNYLYIDISYELTRYGEVVYIRGWVRCGFNKVSLEYYIMPEIIPDIFLKLNSKLMKHLGSDFYGIKFYPYLYCAEFKSSYTIKGNAVKKVVTVEEI